MDIMHSILCIMSVHDMGMCLLGQLRFHGHYNHVIFLLLDMGTLGSVKKRAAPLPPPPSGGAGQQSYNPYGTLPSSHNRSPSDPNPAYHTLNHHKRSPSTDSTRTPGGVHLGENPFFFFFVQVHILKCPAPWSIKWP